MRSISKYKIITFSIIVISFLIGSLSVTGLLQSTEKVSSSGVIVRPSPPAVIAPSGPSGSTPRPPPPEPKIEINLYVDSECTKRLSTITWGSVVAGKSASSTVYVKNEGTVDVVLSLEIENWVPESVENYVEVDWDYIGGELRPGRELKIIFYLDVAGNTPEVSVFSFDIIIVAS